VHRTIEIVAPPSYTDTLTHQLEQLEQVISLSVVREASIKPAGDVLTVHVLNRGADEVLRLAEATQEQGQVSISTAELGSIIDPEHERKVANDLDEALWEEAETGLRQQSQITVNYLALMALGGAVATTGFITESPSQQTISLVAAAIIAPGFEPLAKIPIGLGLRRWSVVGAGLKSAGVGYLALVFSAAVVFVVLRLVGMVTVGEFISNSEVETLAHPTLREILLSGCGAVAGMVMVLSYRRYLIPGALIALAVIEAAAMAGAALGAGSIVLALQGLGRVGLDVLLIVVGGVIVVLLKQAIVHRRVPVV
jgi:hypothetical protein